MTVSHSNVSKPASIGTGRRRPDLSGSPSSIFWTTTAFTFPFSSTSIFVGLIEPVEVDPLLLGVAQLLDAAGGLGLGPAVDAVDLLGPEAPRDAQAVHRGVAGAEDGDLLAHGDGRVLEGELVAAHQVDASQELVGAVDLPGLLARDAEEHREAGAGADEDGVVAHLAPAAGRS